MTGFSWKSFFVRIAFIVVGIGIVASTQLVKFSGPEASDGALVQISRNLKSLFGDDSAATAESKSTVPSISTPLPDESSSPTVVTAVGPLDQPPAMPVSCDQSVVSPEAAAIADLLQVRIFESAQGLNGWTGAPTQTQNVVFERLDLSGSYGVATDGTISIPSIGRHLVLGKTLGCVEAIVQTAFFDVNQIRVQVSANFVARKPVTISGAIRAPGTYAFEPGMTVARLIALAGSSSESVSSSASQLRTLVANSKEIRRAIFAARLETRRLEASLDGRARLDLGDSDPADAEMILDSRMLQSEQAALDADLAANSKLQANERAEMEGIGRSSLQVAEQLQVVIDRLSVTQERRDRMQSLTERGLIVGSRMDNLDLNVLAFERVRMDLEREQLQLEVSLRRAQSASDLTAAERRLRLTERLRDLAAQESALSSQLENNEREIAFFESQLAGAGMAIAVVLDRFEASGMRRLEASGTSQLLPGDMVTVAAPVVASESQDQALLLQPVSLTGDLSQEVASQ